MNRSTLRQTVRPTARTLALLLTATVAGLLGACDKTKAPYAAAPDEVTAQTYPKITLDGVLQANTAVDYPAIVVEQGTETRPMSVSIPLRSRCDMDMHVRYQIRWFDAKGRVVGQSEWKETILYSRRNVMLTANALSNNAVDWRADIQTPVN